MLSWAREFWNAVCGKRIFEVAFEFLQIGAIATLWFFIGNVVKIMQRNVIKLVSVPALL